MYPRLQRIPPSLLRTFAEGCYVDSPVYFNASALVRWLNWTKLERLLAMSGQGENLRVLDFACGNGVMFPTWEKGFQNTVAIDLHVTAAERVCKYYGLKKVHLTKANGTLLPFPPATFDLVFAASTLEHFPDLSEPLREVHRVLRVGGSMLFLCPNENRFYDWGRRIARYQKPPDHYHTAAEVLSVVGGFFKVEAVSNFPSCCPPFLSIYRMGKATKD